MLYYKILIFKALSPTYWLLDEGVVYPVNIMMKDPGTLTQDLETIYHGPLYS